MTNLIYIELALADDKPFDGLTTSTRRGSPFIDMMGNEVEITQADLEEIVANTKAVLETTVTESGELVGLPIDARGHDKGDGAGWIVGIELASDVIRIVPRWTEIGRELIAKGIRRLFSASLDLSSKVIQGGTLTNWPAVRGSDGRLLLRPIELSNDLQVIDFAKQEGYMPEEIKFEDLPKGEQAKLRHQALAELQAEFTAPDSEGKEPVDLESVKSDLMAAMMVRARAQVEAELKAELEAERRQASIAEFCNRVTGGTAETPAGLPVEADRLAVLMGKLEDGERAELEAILSAVLDKGLISFEEKGHGKSIKGGRAELEPAIKAQLAKAVEAGHSIEKFFELSGAVIGSPDDYDLTEFEEKE